MSGEEGGDEEEEKEEEEEEGERRREGGAVPHPAPRRQWPGRSGAGMAGESCRSVGSDRGLPVHP